MIKEYFTFTQKERIAIFTLVALILGIYFLPQFVKADHKKPTSQQLAEFRKAEREFAEKNKSPDNKNPDNNNYTEQRGNGMDHAPPYNDEESKPPRLFYFDPNTLDASGWKQLGLRDKTAGTILKYISKGGRFTTPEDLKKIFGLRPDDYQRISAYVRIASRDDAKKFIASNETEHDKNDAVDNYVHRSVVRTSNSNIRTDNENTRSPYTPKKLRIVDINSADSTALIALPGIGSKLAARILNFRDKLGGFYHVTQVKETYGLPDSTFEKIKPWLAIDASRIKKINVNTATLEELKQHPYIKWNLATAVIRYREQHGLFKSLPQLQQIGVWTEEVYTKLLPYLSMQ